MASRGHRVIGCAQYLLSEDKYPTDYQFSKKDVNYPDSEYCFLGLVSLEDPPKHGVREAIGTLRLAGIKVIMVTGTLLTHVDFFFTLHLFVTVSFRR
jgi:sodium/potassium-transporting ATPase subunit alpha